jgi:hypothetical protein
MRVRRKTGIFNRLAQSFSNRKRQNKRLQLARRLAFETFEPRQLLAVDLVVTGLPNGAPLTLWEGGPIELNTTPTDPAVKLGSLTITTAISNLQTRPGMQLDSSVLELTFNGQVDAYNFEDVFNGAKTLISGNSQTALNTEYGDNNVAVSFRLDVTQDELTAIPNPFAISDTLDYADDTITVKAKLTYVLRVEPGDLSSPSETFVEESQLLSITIKDNDFFRQLTLSSDDSDAAEPHAIFYAPQSPVEKGVFKIDVPPEWRGGTVYLGTGGSATLGTDYTLALNPSNPLVPGSFVPQANGRFLLEIPSRVDENNQPAGYATIRIDVVPLGDQVTPESSEDVSVFWSPANQVFHSYIGYPQPQEVDPYVEHYEFTTTG